MSGFDSNPFEDPVDVNPFQDPSVTQVTNSGIDHIESFSPFPDGNSGSTIPASSGPSQPAVLQPSVEPSPKAVAAAAQANLLKQQEELERKAAELERREQELQSRGAPTGKQNNWPPLPKFFPIKPCFYQNFSEEIPQEHQRLCKMIYYLWMWQCVTLFLNVLACLAEFTTNTDAGVDFGLSILWFILFAPCSFLCWFRPVYKAFRSVSPSISSSSSSFSWLRSPSEIALYSSPALHSALQQFISDVYLGSSWAVMFIYGVLKEYFTQTSLSWTLCFSRVTDDSLFCLFDECLFLH
uniref:Secretory carrier-associated membrane protein n=1 Tax=Sinocyclocheilus anshuiensis TaxID=1608454 RepID=A0A671PN97_9TELE